MAYSDQADNDIILIPESGIQFLDFDVSLEGQKIPSFMFHSVDHLTPEEQIYLLDEDEDGELGFTDADSNTHAVKNGTFGASYKDLIKMFAEEWVPVPFFRSKKAAPPQNGPINWVRVRLVNDLMANGSSSDDKNFKLTIAVDTDLLPRNEAGDYVAPSDDDVKNGDEFGFVCHQPYLLDFLDMEWIDDWMYELYRDRMVKHQTGIKLSDGKVMESMAENHESHRFHTACYLSFLQFLGWRLKDISLKLVKSEPAYDVDLVLDLGNSRTCGLVIETIPGEKSAELNTANVLRIRDLSSPERDSSTEPFDSRVEFNMAYFGKNHLSMKSGRSDAFNWHSMVRIGDEAARLAGQIDAKISNSGMSSPKRYLWDEDRREQDWVFNNTITDGPPRLNHGAAAKNTKFSLQITSDGEPLSSFDPMDPEAIWAAEARYSRSSLMTFSISEILMQTLCMINSWDYRKHKGNTMKPRRLNSLVMTIPSAMISQERDILEKRALAAIDLVWLCQGLDVNGVEKPKLEIEWDEASATQLVYVYTEVVETFSGDARSFFELTKRPFIDDPRPEKLRVASVDIGGGTTDLIVCDYQVKGSGGAGVIEPCQVFREGFSIAGDDVLRAIVETQVLDVIKNEMIAADVSENVARSLMITLFGGNTDDKSIEHRKLRQLFVNSIAIPIALKILAQYEKYDPPATASIEGVAFRDVFPAELDAEGGEESIVRVRQYVENSVIERGGSNFVLGEIVFPVNVPLIWKTIDTVLGSSFDAICATLEVYACDVLLLSGRPSRLPYILDKIQQSHVLPPDRIIALHHYSVGEWYPFRDTRSRIKDPKTTAAMGAAIGAISRGIPGPKNFSFQSDLLEYVSTIRYLGRIAEGRIKERDLFYSDVDLNDEDYQFSGSGGEVSGRMDLGFRQLPVDWWPATKIYEIDFATEKIKKWPPVNVTFERKNKKSGASIETFSLSEISHSSDDAPPMSPRDLAFKLKTLPDDDYWLDTGIIFRS